MTQAEGTVLDDADLVSRARRGDEAAFTMIVERHQRAIYGVCLRFLRDHDQAADVAQRTFIRAFTNLERFRGESGVGTWLYRIAMNICKNEVRDARRHEAFAERIAPPSRPPGGLDRVLGSELSRAVAAGMDRLPEKQRWAVELRVRQDLSCQEIAQIMGIRVGAVKVNIHHGMRKLREFLRGSGFAPAGHGAGEAEAEGAGTAPARVREGRR